MLVSDEDEGLLCLCSSISRGQLLIVNKNMPTRGARQHVCFSKTTFLGVCRTHEMPAQLFRGKGPFCRGSRKIRGGFLNMTPASSLYGGSC